MSRKILIIILILCPLLAFAALQKTNFFGNAALTTSIEGESGTMSGPMQIVTDSSASGGKYAVFTLPDGHLTSSIREDGAILINGSPTFLVGFYHDSDDGRQGQYLADDLKTIAGAGFNLMHPVITELTDTAQYRALAPSVGIRTLAAFYKPALTSTVTALKNDQSILGWDIVDDFSSPPGNPTQTPTLVKSRHDAVKSIAPYHLTYGAAGSDPVYQNEKWLGTMDVMGMENYPVSNNDTSYTTEMEYSVAMYLYSRKNLGDGQSLLALPQTFAWPGGRMPTPQEVRNMTYGALIARMNGILYYTYRTYGPLDNILPTIAPTVWSETVKLKHDIDAITPAILGGNYSLYDSSCASCSKFPGRIHAAFYEEAGKTYVIVLNTASSNQTASVPLPIEVSGRLSSLFPGDTRYNSSLTLTGNNITGTLGSYGVGVYSLTP